MENNTENNSLQRWGVLEFNHVSKRGTSMIFGLSRGDYATALARLFNKIDATVDRKRTKQFTFYPFSDDQRILEIDNSKTSNGQWEFASDFRPVTNSDFIRNQRILFHEEYVEDRRRATRKDKKARKKLEKEIKFFNTCFKLAVHYSKDARIYLSKEYASLFTLIGSTTTSSASAQKRSFSEIDNEKEEEEVERPKKKKKE
jgi:hypothetical protein